MIQNIKLLEKQTVANDTMAFTWEKPPGFAFVAGQFCDMTLLNPSETDEDGNTRGFSLAHAPYEEHLVIATRMRDSAFKRVLKDLPIGADVRIDAPYGNFTLHKNVATPAVFLIGGIGITPVRSIIAQATHDQMPHQMTLLYANKTPAHAAFTDDLDGFAKENQHFTFVPVYTEVPESTWSGERGHIDAGMLERYVPDVAAPIYYLSGPASMVKAMRHLLVEVGANEDNIRTEEFTGY